MSQDTLRLRKTPLADTMEAAEVALSDIVKQALDQAIKPEPSFNNPLMTHEQIIREGAANLGISMVHDHDQSEPERQTFTFEPVQNPPSWTKGQLLNVRNRGEFYVVTLLGEEDDPPLKPAPNGALRFTNTALCQDFISKWYATEHHDPRAR
jgi:hypothetical protein